MGPICYPETSIRNYNYSLRNNPEEHSSHRTHYLYINALVHTKRQALIHESLLSLGRLVTAYIQTGKIKETPCILYEIFLCAAISQNCYSGVVNRIV
jgi:hypothetical protein